MTGGVDMDWEMGIGTAKYRRYVRVRSLERVRCRCLWRYEGERKRSRKRRRGVSLRSRPSLLATGSDLMLRQGRHPRSKTGRLSLDAEAPCLSDSVANRPSGSLRMALSLR